MLAEFLTNLFEHGRVQVASRQENSVTDLTEVENVLRGAEAVWRQTLPPDMPEFDVPTAVWSAQRLYAASSCLVYRAIEPEQIRGAL